MESTPPLLLAWHSLVPGQKVLVNHASFVTRSVQVFTERRAGLCAEELLPSPPGIAHGHSVIQQLAHHLRRVVALREHDPASLTRDYDGLLVLVQTLASAALPDSTALCLGGTWIAQALGAPCLPLLAWDPLEALLLGVLVTPPEGVEATLAPLVRLGLTSAVTQVGRGRVRVGDDGMGRVMV